MSHEPAGAERRRSPRCPYLSRGTAYVLCNSKISAIQVETRNISDGGVLIVSEEYLEGERMMLKLDVPGFEESLVECDVAHRSAFERVSFNDEEDDLYACGLAFRRVIPENDLHRTLLSAFGLGGDGPDVGIGDVGSWKQETEESLVPLLSAVGLAVVYASRFAIC